MFLVGSLVAGGLTAFWLVLGAQYSSAGLVLGPFVVAALHISLLLALMLIPGAILLVLCKTWEFLARTLSDLASPSHKIQPPPQTYTLVHTMRLRSGTQIQISVFNGLHTSNRTLPKRLPALPLEMWEHVIDFLWQDSAALRACSFVCRAWVPATRLHLFRSLQLAQEEDYYRYTDVSNTSLQTLPRIESYAYELNISFAGWQRDDHRERIMLQSLPNMHRVRYLYIWDVEWACLSEDLQECIRVLCCRVRLLVIYDALFSHVGELWSVLSESSKLDLLCVKEVHEVSKDNSNRLSLEVRKPQVQNLIIYLPVWSSCSCIPYLLQDPYGIDFPSLTCVFDFHSASQRQRLQGILRIGGDGLEALLTSVTCGNPPAVTEPLDLRHNKRLSSLVVFLSEWPPEAMAHRLQLMSLLQHARSVPLSVLAITCPITDSDTSLERYVADCPLVDDLLAQMLRERPLLRVYLDTTATDRSTRLDLRQPNGGSGEAYVAAFPRATEDGKGRVFFGPAPSVFNLEVPRSAVRDTA